MHGPNNILFCNDGHIEQRQNEKEKVLKGKIRQKNASEKLLGKTRRKNAERFHQIYCCNLPNHDFKS